MPTYSYRCTKCGHKFDAFHSILAPPLKRCKQCAKDSLERLIGAGAGIVFKGSGFYVTDYKKGTSQSNEGTSQQGKEKESSKPSPSEKGAPQKNPSSDTKKKANDSPKQKQENKSKPVSS